MPSCVFLIQSVLNIIVVLFIFCNYAPCKPYEEVKQITIDQYQLLMTTIDGSHVIASNGRSHERTQVVEWRACYVCLVLAKPRFWFVMSSLIRLVAATETCRNIALQVQVRKCTVLNQLVNMYGTNNIHQFLDRVYYNPPTPQVWTSTICYIFVHIPSSISDTIQSQQLIAL